jgi:hypothetical protein
MITLVKWWQSLTPVLKFSDLKEDLHLLVSIISTNDGLQSFLKQVGSLIIFVRSKRSHESSSVCDFSVHSML